MDIKTFETKIQTINNEFTIKENPNNAEFAGVYWRNIFVCTIPNGDIAETKETSRTVILPNGMERKHTSVDNVMAILENYNNRLQNEEGFADSEQEEI